MSVFAGKKQNKPRTKPAMKINIKLTVGLILLVLLLTFIIQNAVVVPVHFLLWTLSMSRSLIILFSILLGIVLGWFLRSYVYHKWQKNQKPLTQRSQKKDVVEDTEISDS
jgi:uncharacterized integral membrane protein